LARQSGAVIRGGLSRLIRFEMSVFEWIELIQLRKIHLKLNCSVLLFILLIYKFFTFHKYFL